MKALVYPALVVSVLTTTVVADDFQPAPVSDLTAAAPSSNATSISDASRAADAAQQASNTNVQLPNPQLGVANSDPATSFAGQMTQEQRVARLEAQINNFVKMNLPGRIDELQQQVQTLTGQLQVQQHDLTLLNQQQRAFFKDLDQRIKQAQISGSGNGDSNNTADAKSSSTKASADDALQTDVQAYQKAFDLLKQKQFTEAKDGFAAYINSFPKGKYIANAHYWSGELYLLDKDYKAAGDEFSIVVNNYSASNKAKDASLKLAMVHANTGQKDLAMKELSLLKQKYPGTTVAQLASIQLQQLQS